jgi:hypothetical protein
MRAFAAELRVRRLGKGRLATFDLLRLNSIRCGQLVTSDFASPSDPTSMLSLESGHFLAEWTGFNSLRLHYNITPGPLAVDCECSKTACLEARVLSCLHLAKQGGGWTSRVRGDLRTSIAPTSLRHLKASCHPAMRHLEPASLTERTRRHDAARN